ncbi:MAG: tetratricopeptide repeat protein [Bacteroidales bacterium]|nr:tetratricopeptide repeat protein [Bacteroidales bacterium]
MKKIVLVMTALVAASTATWAQKAKVKSAENCVILKQFDKAKSDIDEAMVHAKTADDPNTFLTAADVYIECAINGVGDDDMLDKAKSFIEKAEELDAKGNAKGKNIGKAQKAILKYYQQFNGKAQQYGSKAWGDKNFKNAKKAFDYAIWSNKQRLKEAYNEIADTTEIYNSALAAMQEPDYKFAAERFMKTAELGYDGPMSILRANYCFEQMGDSASMEKTLKYGFQKYPESKDVLTTLIQYYLSAQRSSEALVYLNQAIEKDPTNVQYYFARGCLNEKIDVEKAIEDYNIALEKDPKFFNALYNLGVVYYNKGIEIMNVASGERDNKKYDALVKQANDQFMKSAPYLERAVEATDSKENKKYSLDALKSIYYRLVSAELVPDEKYSSVMSRLRELE